MESINMVFMNLFAGQQYRHRHRVQTCGHSGEGEDGTNWDSSTETYTLPYVKQIAIGNMLYNRESFNLVCHNNLEGWNRAVSEREVQEEGDICILIAESCTAETNTML